MSDGSADRKHVLILDDQWQYCRALQRSLRQDFEVSIATNMEQAKEASTGVHVALVDLCLSLEVPNDRSGLEFVEWVKSNHPDARIVVMTALENEGLKEEAMARGADHFLRKPVIISSLLELLNEIL
jgi:two-component system response regulator DesR